MINPDTGLFQATVMAKVAEAEQKKKKEEEGGNVLADVLDGVGNAVDAGDLAVSAYKAVANAMKPDFATGGLETPAKFTTGGGDGAANAFQTAADCTPVADAETSAAEAAAEGSGMLIDAGSAIVDGVGSVIGGIFDGLGSL
jgi:hypothetical protein